MIKIGGAIVADDVALAACAEDVASLARAGARPLVVHGGGPQIDAALRARGAAIAHADGLRATDDVTVEVVEAVLCGPVRARVVAALARRGLVAVGLSGRDAGWLVAEAVQGRVGRPTEVCAELVHRLVERGHVPVVAPVFVNAAGEALNVNADTAAAAIAVAVGAVGLVLVTEVGGVRERGGGSIGELSTSAASAAIAAKVATGGMIPKLDAAIHATRGGVGRVHVVGPRRGELVAALRGARRGTRVLAG
ncbi:MAG: acetylglutamate kinase [Sandaracinaceae bacterium]|nr:acetylglutamate kinase [Sandaracinaceae bacterium]